MLLAIDIGNTNIALGIFQSDKGMPKTSRTRISSLTFQPSAPLVSWRLATSPAATADEYGTKILDLLHYASLERSGIKAVAIANVVPPLTPVFEELAQKYFKLKALIIGEHTKSLLNNLYENPKEVGADRMVNAIAAHAKFGAPCIVVDFGTATTFDCVTKKGEYAGGIIVPGPLLAAESLSLHTAKLPKVEIAKPQRLIGKNTIESIQSGLYFGYLSLVDGILERLKVELGANSKIVATGGLAALIAGDSKFIKKESVFPDLTLEGIYILWDRNS